MGDDRWALQTVDLSAAPEVRPLYVRETGDRTVVASGSGVEVDPGRTLSADTYFGSFPTGAWRDIAVVPLELELELDGDVEIRVLHRNAEGRYQPLHRETSSGKRTVRIPIDESAAIGPGRLAFELEAFGEATLRSAQWLTTKPPQRDVRLGVVLCTFNRLPFLRRTVAELAAAPGADEWLGRIYVINQGEPFRREELVGPGDPADAWVTLIEQENLGGCGGFSRGLYEVAADGDLSHFLLLDDDIVLETGAITRTVQALRWAERPVALGGHMLNLHRPRLLHEAGGRIDADTAEHHPLASGVAVDSPRGLDELLRLPSPDYNAWWFFAGPVDALANDLPMPCFIRGDDIEFGVRLAHAGIPTVAIPGIAVWHEPFYLKSGSWHIYFDVVNRLALAALHGIGSTPRVRRDLLWRFSDLIATSQYGQAALLTTAIEDFARGPEVCLRTDAQRMQRCRSILAEYGPTPVEARIGISEQPDERPWGRLRKWGRLAEGVLLSRSTLNVPTFAAEDDRTAPRAAAPVYDVRSSEDGSATRYGRSAATERTLWRAFSTAVRGLELSPSWAGPRHDDIQDGWRRYWAEHFAGMGRDQVG